ncbi:MAG TPA: CDP-diacylglycerol--glycerol-3-phosphate 3-phosphatidyltransferase, partial [Alphaproteobacteria bacterium]|nr:CDP-diacylglycerol--glycerol-3-phosphate 3-phosphatidyltransferase [Alphaproteobacteria bacterium]
MNLPNLLTLSRIPILFGIVGLLYLPFGGASSMAFALFVIGALTDWADGYVARKQGIVSKFGKLMDALTDKVFMVGLFIALLAVGILPDWTLPLLLLILTREFLITGLRLVAASSGIVLAAEKSGKHKTVSQIIAAILLLLAEAVRVDLRGVAPPWVIDTLHWGGLAFFVIATL